MFARFYGCRALGKLAKHPVKWPVRLYATNELLVKPERIINQPSGSQILISEAAFKRLSAIYRESKEVLKISVESGGCHGFQYNMKLLPDSQVEKELADHATSTHSGTEKATDDDDFEDDFEDNKEVVFVLPKNGGKVVIDENSLKILNKTTLTYSTELIGSTFKISGGNLKSSCGCGSSFDVDSDN